MLSFLFRPLVLYLESGRLLALGLHGICLLCLFMTFASRPYECFKSSATFDERCIFGLETRCGLT